MRTLSKWVPVLAAGLITASIVIGQNGPTIQQSGYGVFLPLKGGTVTGTLNVNGSGTALNFGGSGSLALNGNTLYINSGKTCSIANGSSNDAFVLTCDTPTGSAIPALKLVETANNLNSNDSVFQILANTSTELFNINGVGNIGAAGIDQVAPGVLGIGETNATLIQTVSNVGSGSASAGAFVYNTKNTLSGASDLLVNYKNNNTPEFQVDKSGNGTLAGGITLGSSSAKLTSTFTGTVSASATAGAGSCTTTAGTITGVAVGMSCAIGSDVNLSGALFDCTVTGTNTVDVNICCIAGSCSTAAENYRIRVFN